VRGYIEHTVEQLVGQRLFAMVLGHKDLNDHDRLRFDPLPAPGKSRRAVARTCRAGGVIGRRIAGRRWRARARSTAWN